MKYTSLEYRNIANSSQLFNCSLEHMKPKVNIFDRKKKNAISTSGFQDK